MEFVLIRHGDAERSRFGPYGVNGQGFNLVPLTEKGQQQAAAVARDPALQGAQLILSSPYTRALQTAAEILRVHDLPLVVEPDLHEILCDTTGAPHTLEENHDLHRDFLKNKGQWPEGETRVWETADQLAERVRRVLERYRTRYDKIVVVTHGGVIRRFVTDHDILNCHPYVVQAEGPITCYGWVEV